MTRSRSVTPKPVIRWEEKPQVCIADVTHLTLPYPPTANNMKAVIRGRLRKTPEARAYTDEVQRICLRAGIKPQDGFLCVQIDVYRPIKRGDLANSEKACLDSIKDFAYNDDSQICRLIMNRFDDPEYPRVEITITPLRREPAL